MKAAIWWLYNISYWWPVHTMFSVRFWHRADSQIRILRCAIDMSAHI